MPTFLKVISLTSPPCDSIKAADFGDYSSWTHTKHFTSKRETRETHLKLRDQLPTAKNIDNPHHRTHNARSAGLPTYSIVTGKEFPIRHIRSSLCDNTTRTYKLGIYVALQYGEFRGRLEVTKRRLNKASTIVHLTEGPSTVSSFTALYRRGVKNSDRRLRLETNVGLT